MKAHLLSYNLLRNHKIAPYFTEDKINQSRHNDVSDPLKKRCSESNDLDARISDGYDHIEVLCTVT